MENIKAIWKNNFKSLFEKKSVYETNLKASNHNKLKKSLSLFQVITLGIGVIVGAGIFVLTGIASGMHAGPAITISFALSGIICICAGLCYAEFSSILHTSGSSYSYTYITFGRFPAWIVGSISAIGYFLGAVSVAVGWSGYFSDILHNFNLGLPEKFALPTGTEYNVQGGVYHAIFDIPAFTISFISTLVLYRGITLSSIITSFSVVIKLLVLLCFIVIGMFYIDTNNWIPYIPQNTGKFGEYGVSGIITGISMVFLAFNGFDSICTSAQEVKNPRKNIPLGIIITIITVTIIYILTSAVMTGLVSYKELNVPQALAVAVDKIGLPWLNYLVKFGAVAGLSSVIIVSQYTVIRMLLIMAEDNLLPKIFARVHSKNKTPHVITLAIGLSMSFIAATTNLQNIVKLSSFFILLTIVIICISTIVMRYTEPKLNRDFRCPLMPVTPAIAILLAIYIMSSYPLLVYLNACTVLVILTFLYFINSRFRAHK
jgi:APA family basic amino acid/polyamine antiporter